jgi:hypothetical protein
LITSTLSGGRGVDAHDYLEEKVEIDETHVQHEFEQEDANIVRVETVIRLGRLSPE